MDVSLNGGNPKSSILIGFSIINHPFWGTPIFGDTHIGISMLSFGMLSFGGWIKPRSPFAPWPPKPVNAVFRCLRFGAGFLGILVVNQRHSQLFGLKCLVEFKLLYIAHRAAAVSYNKKTLISLPKTSIFALKIGRNPRGKDRLPTMNFQGQASC